jgi:hypothetical protein
MMWSPHEIDSTLGQDTASRQPHYRALFNEALDREVTTKIGRCANKCLVLGTAHFRERVSLLTS